MKQIIFLFVLALAVDASQSIEDRRDQTVEHCVVCSSETNKNCIYNTRGFEAQCPTANETLGCFLKIDDKNHVDRGCMSQLTQEQREYCRAGNGTCKSCIGENCNQKRNFQKCYYCDSEVDGRICITVPWSMEPKMCPNYLDHCYTQVMNGRVRRNCIGDETVPTVEHCEGNSANCKHCDDRHGCNDENVSKEKCVSCNSAIDPTCATNTTFHVFEECPLSINPNKCYHMINATTGEHTRGCVQSLSSPLIELCEQNGDECKVCSNSECNSRTTFLKCLNCVTSNDQQCATDPPSAESKVCEKYDSQCFTYIGQFNVSRGCAPDKNHALMRSCRDNPKKCELCDTLDENGCNNQTVQIESCVECDSDTDWNCHDEPELHKNKICSGFDKQERARCYLKVTDGRYQRGCLNDLEEFSQHLCESNSLTSDCKTCNGTNCNLKKDFQHCISCNSRDNIDCLGRNLLKKSVVCGSYHSACLTGIDKFGHTHRRCSKGHSADSLEFSTRFAVYTQNNGNSEKYPPNRLECYQCEGSDDCDYTYGKFKRPKPCSMYSEYNKCYAYLSEDHKIYRGCMSDSTESRLRCDPHDPNAKGVCIQCNESGCNNIPKIRKPSLSCVHCDHSKECAFGHVNESVHHCSNDVLFGSKESCYIRFNETDGWAERGCTLDAKENLWTNDVKLCSEPGCNFKNILHSQCVCCESDLQGDCARIAYKENFMKQCDGTYSFEQRGCYNMGKNGTVRRGCIKDLMKIDHENANLCFEDGCNAYSIYM